MGTGKGRHCLGIGFLLPGEMGSHERILSGVIDLGSFVPIIILEIT